MPKQLRIDRKRYPQWVNHSSAFSSRRGGKNGTIEDQFRGIGAHDGMRFHDLLRFGSDQPTDTGVPADPAIQISGIDSMADKLISLQAAESQPPKQQAAPADANATEAEKIAAAVDLAISLEDG